MFFEIMGVGPRGDTEEGGQYVFRFGFKRGNLFGTALLC
jgi:hypothetical protein